MKKGRFLISAGLIPEYNEIPGLKDFTFGGPNATIGNVFSVALTYVFIVAGLGLFIYLIMGGLRLMLSGGDPNSIEQAKGKITNALLGFVIIFCSFWLVQIMEKIFHLQILGP
ncbi:hypothetical protein FJZ40_04990 [Candidatus Shapirobacteria bacterium]|nr:hypothetical protein [Candidatus Shapirobacteria bacterium]